MINDIMPGGEKLNNMTWVFAMLPLLIIVMDNRRRNRAFVKKRIMSRKNKKEKKIMYEIVKEYIDKECIIYTMNSSLNSQITGTIKGITEGWISVQTSDSVEAINLEFVTRIREYPRNKKGKKKLIID